MIVVITSGITGTSPQKFFSNYPLYKWRLLSASATATGTSTADSSVTVSLVRNGVSLVLLLVSSTSTVLTVSGSLESFVQSSTAGATEQGNLTFPLILAYAPSGADYIEVAWVNNGSYSWQLVFEEFI